MESSYVGIVYICFCLVVLFLTLFSFKTYAVQSNFLASSSDGFYDELESEFDYRRLEEKFEMLIDKLDLLLATSSDVETATDSDTVKEESGENIVIPYLEDVRVRSVRAVNNFRRGFKKYSNLLRFDVSYGGSKAVLLFPSHYIDVLTVSDDGYLINTGSDTVGGILLNGDSDLNLNADSQTQVIISSIMNSNGYSSVRNNGSYSFYRTYYWTRVHGRNVLNSRDTYTKFKVLKTYYMYKNSDTLMLLLLFFSGGVFIVCFLTELRKY